jgi:hypothetical protein
VRATPRSSAARSPETGGTVLVGFVAAALGSLSGLGAVTGLALAILAVGGGVSLRAAVGSSAEAYRFLLFAAGLAVLAASAPFTLTNILLALGGGVGLLLLLVPTDLAGGAWAEGSRAIVWPLLAGVLGVLTVTLFAGVRSFVGAAALLWVGLLLLLLGVYTHPRSFALGPEDPTSPPEVEGEGAVPAGGVPAEPDGGDPASPS